MYNEMGVEDIKRQTTGEGTYIARSSVLDDAVRASLVDKLSERFNTEVTVMRFESVGPTIGREVMPAPCRRLRLPPDRGVLLDVCLPGVPNALRFGVCAIIAIIDDVAIVSA